MRDVVNAYKRSKNSSLWGIHGYECPKNDSHLDKIRNIRIVNDKKITFIDQEVKKKIGVPAFN